MFIVECCNHLFSCNHTCHCVGMVSVTSASHYQSRPSMYILDPIPRNGPSQFRLYDVMQFAGDITLTGPFKIPMSLNSCYVFIKRFFFWYSPIYRQSQEDLNLQFLTLKLKQLKENIPFISNLGPTSASSIFFPPSVLWYTWCLKVLK